MASAASASFAELAEHWACVFLFSFVEARLVPATLPSVPSMPKEAAQILEASELHCVA